MARIGFGEPLRGGRKRIRLELTEPNKDGEAWSITAVATVVDGDEPAPDVEVQFYYNGRTIDSPFATDGEGRATKDFQGLEKGNHSFEAQIIGTAIKSRQSKNLKDEGSKKIPNLLEVTCVGGRGRQRLLISLSDKEGGMIKNFTGVILDGDSPKPFKTGNDGTYVYEMNFSEKERVVEIRAGNDPDLIWTEVLPGPQVSNKKGGC